MPVLVGSATMPTPAALPEVLRRLAELNALKLRDDEWEGLDFPRLATVLEQHGFKSAAKSATSGPLKVSSRAPAAAVIMAVASYPILLGGDSEEQLGGLVVELIALSVAYFAYRDTKAGRAKGQSLAILVMVFSVLLAIASFG